MNAVLRATAMILSTIIAISYTTPIFISVLVPLSVAYYWVRVSGITMKLVCALKIIWIVMKGYV